MVVDDDGGRRWWTTAMWRRWMAWGGGGIGWRSKQHGQTADGRRGNRRRRLGVDRRVGERRRRWPDGQAVALGVEAGWAVKRADDGHRQASGRRPAAGERAATGGGWAGSYRRRVVGAATAVRFRGEEEK
jgi:hypothetical protein